MKKNLGIFDHVDFLKSKHPCVINGCFAFVKNTGTVFLHTLEGWKNTKLPREQFDLMAQADGSIEDFKEEDVKFVTEEDQVDDVKTDEPKEDDVEDDGGKEESDEEKDSDEPKEENVEESDEEKDSDEPKEDE
jgi:hypothetical protein